MLDDGMTIAVGAPDNNDNWHYSGHLRVFAYSHTTNTWYHLGNTTEGAVSGDRFGIAVSIPISSNTFI